VSLTEHVCHIGYIKTILNATALIFTLHGDPADTASLLCQTLMN